MGPPRSRTGAAGVVTANFATGTPAEAAAFVQYMTGAPGSSPWADRRVASGHRAPYDVPWWEVGNEESVSPYWALDPAVHVGGPVGCHPVKTCLYVYGGTTEVSGQRLVTADDRPPSARVSRGTPPQSFEVAYPPGVPGTLAIRVAGITWDEVASLTGQPPTAAVYTLDPSTGQIQFGDGNQGAIPPAGAVITADYDSGPHAGFVAFYRAMKHANPAIHICASELSNSFIRMMGATLPYDCLQVHPYISPRTLSSTELIGAYERQVMGAPYLESLAVAHRQAQVSHATGRRVPIVLSEYGQLVSSTPDRFEVPYYLSSLDEALLNASQLADWIRLGIPVADRQLLDAELPLPGETTDTLRHIAPSAAGGAIVTDGARTVVEPTGQVFGMMRPLAGEQRLGIAVASDPQLTLAGGHRIGALNVVAGTGHGEVNVLAINRNPVAARPCRIVFRGLHLSGTATVTVLDGPSAISMNTIARPHVVATHTRRVALRDGRVSLTLPPHSVARIGLAGL